MGIKLCKGMWLEADKFQFILKRSITKSPGKYAADVKRAKARGMSTADIKRYTSEETFHPSIERTLEVALEYSLRDNELLQETQETEEGKSMKKPVGAKKIEALTDAVSAAKDDIVKTFKESLEDFTKENVMIIEKNKELKLEVKRLKDIIKHKGFNEG